MRKFTILVIALLISFTLAACGGPSVAPAPLSTGNLNMIFVVSEDLAYHASGDVDSNTANLTNQGLQRSLLMATFLKQQVLGTKNVNGIYAIEPMTHLQTSNNYPDMTALVTIQQFALLNQITMTSGTAGEPPCTANSYPVNVSYAPGPVPAGVAAPFLPAKGCQGLDFKDQGGANETLLAGIIKANTPGFYIFSAPWETVSGLMANINKLQGFNLALPAIYKSPDYIYVISIAPSGSASLVTYNSNLNPPATYPSPKVTSTASTATPFSITVTGGVGGAVIPAGINTNETLYMIRHAEAHPGYFDDGNYIGAGQWRALALPDALRGKISPDQVYSIDPAQVLPGTVSASDQAYWSYVRPSLTVAPYAIANNLPYNLAASFEIFAENPPQLCPNASAFFFTGGKFSNQKVLVAWEHGHIPPTVNALLSSYFPNGGAPTAPAWAAENDYDTIWTVTLDAKGNVTVDNSMCEGILSSALPATCPQY
ncbi:MAG: hypothetical protein ABSA18_08690 [Dehalococcoidia bacterium]|jgi:hypothetical protein